MTEESCRLTASVTCAVRAPSPKLFAAAFNSRQIELPGTATSRLVVVALEHYQELVLVQDLLATVVSCRSARAQDAPPVVASTCFVLNCFRAAGQVNHHSWSRLALGDHDTAVCMQSWW